MARGDAAEDGGARPAGMGSGTWRKAYGALKDSTKVGLANFNSEYKVMTTMLPLRCPIDRCPSIHPPRRAPPPGLPSHGVRLSSSLPALRHIMAIVKAFNFLNSLQDLDIAIVKATNHVECPPKERHFRSEC